MRLYLFDLTLIDYAKSNLLSDFRPKKQSKGPGVTEHREKERGKQEREETDSLTLSNFHTRLLVQLIVTFAYSRDKKTC